MGSRPTYSVTRLWRGLKFILLDWTVTPGMMSLNKQHPFVYQLVTASVVTLVFGLLVAVAIVVISLLGPWPSR